MLLISFVGVFAVCRFLADYGIEAIDAPGDPEAVMVCAVKYEYRLKRFAAFNGVRESALEMAPQVIRNRWGSDAYVYLLRSDFETLAYALPDPDVLFHTRYRERPGKDYDAWGTLMDDGMFFVHAGSTMATSEAPELDFRASKERRRLIEGEVGEKEKFVREAYGHYEFLRDVQFRTPALAASVVTGYRRANDLWVNWQGTTMASTGQRDRQNLSDF